MPDDLVTTLRRTVLAVLGARPSATRLRAVAKVLDGLAAELRRQADADANVGHRLRRADLDAQPHSPRGGRVRGAGGRFVRVDQPKSGAGGALVHISRALYYELGSPARLDPQVRPDRQIVLRPCADGEGYAVTALPKASPKFSCSGEMLELLGLDYGQRYRSTIEAGVIVVGAALEQPD